MARRSASSIALRFVCVTAALLVVLRLFVLEPFVMHSAAMRPTLLEGDWALVFKLRYGIEAPFFQHLTWSWGLPRRGDLVLLRDSAARFTIRRIVALSGDRVEWRAGNLAINGRALATKLVKRAVPCSEVSLDAITDTGEPFEPKTSACDVWSEQAADGGSYQVLNDADSVPPDRSRSVAPGRVLTIPDNRGDAAQDELLEEIPMSAIMGHVFAVVWSVGWGPDGGASETRWSRILKVLT